MTSIGRFETLLEIYFSDDEKHIDRTKRLRLSAFQAVDRLTDVWATIRSHNMTRVLYGFSGEGSGHSSRAREMARALIAAGHQVKLCSYDRGYRNLCSEFDVFEIEGLTIGSSDNRVSIVKTFTENLKRLPDAGRAAFALRDVFKSYEPHCVITDFEPMTAVLAHHFGLPLISVDNQHRMRYVEHEIPEGREQEALMTRTIIRMMVPSPDVALVTSLVPGQPKNDRTFIFPPMVASEVRQLSTSHGDTILVYVTNGFDSLINLLKQFSRERFLVYGTGRPKGIDGNLEYFEPSRPRFLEQLAAAKAVIATAGFTLISEALYLRKPYLAFPMEGQYEQELNAFQLAQSGWGRAASESGYETIGSFLYDLPDINNKLSVLPPMDNGEAIKHKLLELVANDAEMAGAYRAKRKGESSQFDE
jgi:uncharacterized protein (TIGR00661 family)